MNASLYNATEHFSDDILLATNSTKIYYREVQMPSTLLSAQLTYNEAITFQAACKAEPLVSEFGRSTLSQCEKITRTLGEAIQKYELMKSSNSLSRLFSIVSRASARDSLKSEQALTISSCSDVAKSTLENAKDARALSLIHI